MEGFGIREGREGERPRSKGDGNREWGGGGGGWNPDGGRGRLWTRGKPVEGGNVGTQGRGDRNWQRWWRAW